VFGDGGVDVVVEDVAGGRRGEVTWGCLAIGKNELVELR
jgi:hypothetical protein